MRLRSLAHAVAGTVIMVALGASSWMTAQSAGGTVLKPADLEKLFPATVFYFGQTATAQIRNSGGIKFADGHYVLASLVDTGGYSTSIAAKYQGYLLAEVPVKIDGKNLPAGAYGFGFLPGDKFLITDLGGSDVLAARSTSDTAMTRPRPLQVIADQVGGYRLYAGRNYVQFNR